MPTNKTTPSTGATPGLSSIDNTKKVITPAVKKPVVTTTTSVKKPKPVAVIPKSTLAKKVKTTKTAPPEYTSSSFNVGKNKYNIIDDNEETRKLITYDDKGNVSPDSAVHVIGENVSGGFILAANEGLTGVKKSYFPYSKTGIHFPSLRSDAPGATPSMQGIYSGTYKDISEVANAKAAASLRGIYKRTKRL